MFAFSERRAAKTAELVRGESEDSTGRGTVETRRAREAETGDQSSAPAAGRTGRD